MKTFSVFALAVALTTALFSGCAPSGADAPRPSGRPGPVYIQWLEEQACLRRAVSVTSVVSGSSLNWRRGSRASLLPEEARTWFFASPALTAWSGSGSLTEALVGEHAEARLAGLGVQGVLLADLADTGDEWAGRSPAVGLGTDGVGLSLGRLAGTEESFSRWMAALAGKGLLSGGTLLPADTGAGPDFFLSLRGVRDYPGLYAMTEISPQLWPLLPSLKKEETAPLAEGAVAALAAQGELPATLVQDAVSEPPRGWAVTGPVDGVDGVKRRWAYRWHGRFDRPVLHWDDPSGAARRVMEAGLIDQIGLRHEALIGVSVGAWLGLDGPNDVTGRDAAGAGLEPGLSALRDLTRNAHRYGAAVLVRDALPAPLLVPLADSGADFFFDSVLFPALEQSLLTGEARYARESLRRARAAGVDQRRLWRMAPEGLPRPGNARLAALMPEGWASLLTPSPDASLRINAPTLAAAACGLAPGARPNSDDAPAVRDAHALLLAARAFLPGLFMLSGTDLDGSLPEGHDWPGTPPLWQPNGSPSSRRGLPSGYPLYRRAPGCAMDDLIRSMLAARASCGIASGEFLDAPDCEDPGVLTLVSALPGGEALAFFGNVSRQSATFSPRFSRWAQASERRDLLSGSAVPEKRMTLPPHAWRAVLLR